MYEEFWWSIWITESNRFKYVLETGYDRYSASLVKGDQIVWSFGQGLKNRPYPRAVGAEHRPKFRSRWRPRMSEISSIGCTATDGLTNFIGLLNWYWWILARVGCKNARACECILKPTSANIHQYPFNNSFII